MPENIIVTPGAGAGAGAGAEGAGSGKEGGAGAPDNQGAGGEGGAGGPGAGSGGAAAAALDDNEIIELAPGEKLTRKELREANLRHKDYTQKTQTLAQREQQITALENFGKWFDDPKVPAMDKVNFIAKELNITLPEAKAVKKQIEDGGDFGDGGDGGDGDGAPDPRDQKIAALEQKIAGFEKGLQARDLAAAKKEIDREMATVKTKYPDMSEEDEEVILSNREVQAGGDIIGVADKYFAHLETRKATWIKKYLEDKTKDKGEGKVHVAAGGGRTGAPAGPIKLEDGSAKRSFAERLKASFNSAKE